MTPRIALDNYYVALTSLSVSLLVLFFCITLYFKARKTPLLKYFLASQAMLILWLLAKLMKTASPTLEIRWFFIALQYFGICSLNYTFVQFAWFFAYAKEMTPFRKFLTLLPTAISFILISLNPLHMLFYSKFDLYRDSFGVLFYPHQLMSYLYLIYGIYLCTKEYNNSFQMKYVQSKLFAIAILIPIFFNVLYVTKTLKKIFSIRLPMDITPLTAIISLGLFAFAIRKYRFLDIAPLAYEKALTHSDQAIAICNSQGLITDCNLKLCSVLKQSHSYITTLSESALLAGMEPYHLTFENSVYPIDNSRGIHLGRILKWTDHRQLKQAVLELDTQNQVLKQLNKQMAQHSEHLKEIEHIKTTNRISRDLHDVLGNTLVLTKTNLELLKLKQTRGQVDPTTILIQIDTAAKTIENGFEQLNLTISPNAENKSLPLDLRLKMLADQFIENSCHVKLQFDAPLPQWDDPISDAIYAIVREAFTNAVRHGGANEIYLLYRYNANTDQLFIINNGKGCSHIEKGMGLTGMQERANAIGATIHFTSCLEGGFTVLLNLKSPHLD